MGWVEQSNSIFKHSLTRVFLYIVSVEIFPEFWSSSAGTLTIVDIALS